MKTKEEKFIVAFGKNLQSLRKSKGFTQEDLSAKSDILRTQLGRIERGEVNTTLKTMLRLADALEIEITDLLKFKK